ncbi:MAG: amidohydrolase family protein [Xanthomonadales bacterium]|nr:amidohydrolase family protein [Xanthomonadales bacterium]
MNRSVLLSAVLAIVPPGLSAETPPPILDVHLHAFDPATFLPAPMPICVTPERMPAHDPAGPFVASFGAWLGGCARKEHSAADADELMQRSLAVLERRNIHAVVSGPPALVRTWREAAPDRLIPGVTLISLGSDEPDLEALRALHADGELAVLGEVAVQYVGMAPDDARLAPYWALAEELDIPVGIHIGVGPPGVAYLNSPAYRGRMSSVLALEEVLVRHPRLRVYVMHAGFPMLDDLLTLLYGHPQVYVDIAILAYGLPRAHFHRYLQRIVEGGFVDRVMFGSDQMVWPDTIEHAIEAIENAPYLDEAARRAILYDNAARFLRLDEATIARHHGRTP